MNWLPTFTNWQAGAIAAAVVVPSLLVLYFLKLRRREQTVPSTLLWRKAIQDLQVNAPFQKLRRNLLLLLQMLLLLLLVLALSRPVANYYRGAGATSVIIIDRSASMNARDVKGGKTRLDEAKRRARELVDSMQRGATAMVIAFDDTAETLQPFTTDTTALRRAIEAFTPTDRRSSLKMAYQLADAQLMFIPEQNRTNKDPPDIHVYSDGRVQDEKELAVQGKVVFEKIGTDEASNVGIVALSAKRNYENPVQVQVFARLANFGPRPVETFVHLTLDGEKVDTGQNRSTGLMLLPERWTDEQRTTWERENGRGAPSSVDFPMELTTSAVIRVEHTNKDNDVLAADDAAQVVVPPPKQLSVALVTDGGNYFLEKAVQSLNLKNPATLRPEAYEDKAGGPDFSYDVVIFDRYTPQKLPPAGNFIYFGAVPNGLKVKAAATPQGGYELVEDFGVLEWKRDHPVLRNLAMQKLYVAEAIRLVGAAENSEVLLDGLKCPLIVLHREGKGVHLIVAFDLLQSNWPLKVSFPIFLFNSLQFLAVGSNMDVRQSLEPGATPRIPRTAAVEGLKQITVKGPGGFGNRTVKVPEAGDFALPPLDYVGVYQTDPPVPQYEQMAVNLLDSNESNVQPAPATNALGGLAAEVREADANKSRMELWWWVVACAALPLLLIEWWVYTRRVHL
jgi:hypothetical protein